VADLSYLDKLKGVERGSGVKEGYGLEDSVQNAFAGQKPMTVQPELSDEQLAANAARNADTQKSVMAKLIQDEQQKNLAAQIAAQKPQPEFDQQAYQQKDAELRALMNEFAKTKKVLGK